jgi:hypothetical protein
VSCLNRQNLDVTDGEAQRAARRSLGKFGGMIWSSVYSEVLTRDLVWAMAFNHLP